jgi:hypothetical protein
MTKPKETRFSNPRLINNSASSPSLGALGHSALVLATKLFRCYREPVSTGMVAVFPWTDTDWEQIVLLYGMLLHLAPAPLTRLHRAIALRHTAVPHAALAEVDALSTMLGHYHLYHATRAELLRALGHPHAARAADQCALGLTTRPAEQAILPRRIDWDDVWRDSLGGEHDRSITV